MIRPNQPFTGRVLFFFPSGERIVKPDGTKNVYLVTLPENVKALIGDHIYITPRSVIGKHIDAVYAAILDEGERPEPPEPL